ncbi:MAG: helix-turn-helix transcriptional regulator [Clostridia bacterium]|nr:helix-turn-helix transcriptional regulator [Clostridia bacterium]
MAAELDTPALHEALQAHEHEIDAFRTQVVDGLKSAGALECSQKLMGKTFRNRGPYEQFFFLPSLLFPFKALRLFYDNGTPHNRQILFYSIRRPETSREDTIAALKALSDETRYQILLLLAKRGSVNGQEIVRALKLAPSTVSHHMTELKERGLITEEAVKTAKYYGISKNVLRELLKTVSNDLDLDVSGTPVENDLP